MFTFFTSHSLVVELLDLTKDNISFHRIWQHICYILMWSSILFIHFIHERHISNRGFIIKINSGCPSNTFSLFSLISLFTHLLLRNLNHRPKHEITRDVSTWSNTRDLFVPIEHSLMLWRSSDCLKIDITIIFLHLRFCAQVRLIVSFLVYSHWLFIDMTFPRLLYFISNAFLKFIFMSILSLLSYSYQPLLYSFNTVSSVMQ